MNLVKNVVYYVLVHELFYDNGWKKHYSRLKDVLTRNEWEWQEMDKSSN